MKSNQKASKSKDAQDSAVETAKETPAAQVEETTVSSNNPFVSPVARKPLSETISNMCDFLNNAEKEGYVMNYYFGYENEPEALRKELQKVTADQIGRLIGSYGETVRRSIITALQNCKISEKNASWMKGLNQNPLSIVYSVTASNRKLGMLIRQVDDGTLPQTLHEIIADSFVENGTIKTISYASSYNHDLHEASPEVAKLVQAMNDVIGTIARNPEIMSWQGHVEHNAAVSCVRSLYDRGLLQERPNYLAPQTTDVSTMPQCIATVASIRATHAMLQQTIRTTNPMPWSESTYTGKAAIEIQQSPFFVQSMTNFRQAGLRFFRSAVIDYPRGKCTLTTVFENFSEFLVSASSYVDSLFEDIRNYVAALDLVDIDISQAVKDEITRMTNVRIKQASGSFDEERYELPF